MPCWTPQAEKWYTSSSPPTQSAPPKRICGNICLLRPAGGVATQMAVNDMSMNYVAVNYVAMSHGRGRESHGVNYTAVNYMAVNEAVN